MFVEYSPIEKGDRELDKTEGKNTKQEKGQLNLNCCLVSERGFHEVRLTCFALLSLPVTARGSSSVAPRGYANAFTPTPVVLQ